MDSTDIFESFGQKGADREAIAAEVRKHPELIPELLEGLKAKKANIKESHAGTPVGVRFLAVVLVLYLWRIQRLFR